MRLFQKGIINRQLEGVKEHCPELWDLIIEHKGVFTIHEDHVHLPQTDQLCHKCYNCDYCSHLLIGGGVQTLKISESMEKVSESVKECCPELWDLILKHEGVFIAHGDHVHVAEKNKCRSSHKCEWCSQTLRRQVPLQEIIDYYGKSQVGNSSTPLSTDSMEEKIVICLLYTSDAADEP